MTGLVCPHCNSSFDSDKRLARAEVAECKLCQQKFVVTQNTLKAYQDLKPKPKVEQSVQTPPSTQPLKESFVRINCPHCSTELQGQMAPGQIVECSECHKPFEATPERLNHKNLVLAKAAANIPDTVSRKPKSRAGLLALIFLGLVIASSFIMPKSTSTKKVNAGKASAPAPVVTDPNAIENFLSVWDGSNRELVKLVKSGMNDPDSFEHVETRFTDHGDSLSLFMTFRGKNGFNATVTNKVSADLNKRTRRLSNVQQR